LLTAALSRILSEILSRVLSEILSRLLSEILSKLIWRQTSGVYIVHHIGSGVVTFLLICDHTTFSLRMSSSNAGTCTLQSISWRTLKETDDL
jgi:hypothetical protein